MKILIIVLLFSFSASANWVKESDLKSPQIVWTKKSRCESVSGEQCFDVSAKDMRRWMKGLVDNPDSPKYSKKGSVVCSDLESCQTQRTLIDCSIFAEGSFGVIALDFSEVYCAQPNGFNQMDGIVPDPIGIAAADAEDQAKANEKASRLSKVGPRFTALKACAVNADALTSPQLRTCLKRLIREVLAARMLLSEL